MLVPGFREGKEGSKRKPLHRKVSPWQIRVLCAHGKIIGRLHLTSNRKAASELMSHVLGTPGSNTILISRTRGGHQ
jgi:hypothetical protein